MKKLKYLLAVVFVISAIFFGHKPVSSENFNSDNFRIQFGNVNIGGENLDSDTYDLSTSIGQSFAEKFQSLVLFS